MTSALLLAERAEGAASQVSLWPEERPAATLGELVDGAWDGLAAGAPVGCPVCGDLMLPRAGEGACRGCGSSLA